MSILQIHTKIKIGFKCKLDVAIFFKVQKVTFFSKGFPLSNLLRFAAAMSN
ncbi:MAG: hypothetical protein JWR61_5757 [Ferruginibacter sp.]|nr:hypothetical protein [Ferruginibacter sp.]